MYDKREMKRLVLAATVAQVASISIGNNNITLESYDNLDFEFSVHITTLDFETDVRTNQIINAQVDEKHQCNEILCHHVKSCLEDIES